MGKGYNNYMCKKFFHPASRDNLKRVWMAEQKNDAYKKKQEELRLQYEKEQDLYNNKAMLSKESKEKLSVNFMYEPPPGMKREREKEEGEPEYKFEWQRKFNAPREDYCKGDEEIRDQPFGIQVRNVRCIKCHKWGHTNIDRECPLYGQNNDLNELESDPLLLMHKMREEGFLIKQGVFGIRQNAPGVNQELLDESDEEVSLPNTSNSKVTKDESKAEGFDFLKSLSTKEKKKLLKKLEKHEKNIKRLKKRKKKLKDKRKKHKKSSKSSNKDSSSSSGSNDDSDSSSSSSSIEMKKSKDKKHEKRIDRENRDANNSRRDHKTDRRDRNIKRSRSRSRSRSPKEVGGRSNNHKNSENSENHSHRRNRSRSPRHSGRRGRH